MNAASAVVGSSPGELPKILSANVSINQKFELLG